MESDGDERAIVPFRHRHDGWTRERQDRFLERLKGTGSVTEACRAVGLTTTSAYRAYHRMPEFAMYWNRALDARRPMLEDAAFERAVHGTSVPLTRLGKVVGQRQRFSDGLLRFLIERQDRLDAQAAAPRSARSGRNDPPVEVATAEETNAVLLKQLKIIDEENKRKARAKMIEWADRMRREGKAP